MALVISFAPFFLNDSLEFHNQKLLLSLSLYLHSLDTIEVILLSLNPARVQFNIFVALLKQCVERFQLNVSVCLEALDLSLRLLQLLL